MTDHEPEDGSGHTVDTERTQGRWERFASSRRFVPQKPLAAVVGLVGFLAAVAGLVSGIEAMWPHKRESDIARVHSLLLGSDIDAVERSLGGENRVATYRGDSDDYSIKPQGPTSGLLVRIYRLHRVFVQVGYRANSGTVAEWVVQSCDPKVKIKFSRSGADANPPPTVTLNQTTMSQMTRGNIPSRVQYRTYADASSERLEFSAPSVASGATSEVWGTSGGLCDSPWRGAGEE
ncbi:hypothetical protein, partial [Streptomyces barringtoniae]|uniref:hypothetical protein n=1 Tax=Streptomyces barringtoniae TaxID=2892029 RepID=UPI001E2BAB81